MADPRALIHQSSRAQWCPVCKTYHEKVGEKTDARAVTHPCPCIPANDPRNLP